MTFDEFKGKWKLPSSILVWSIADKYIVRRIDAILALTPTAAAERVRRLEAVAKTGHAYLFANDGYSDKWAAFKDALEDLDKKDTPDA